MMIIAVWILMSIAGFCMVFLGGYFFGGTNGVAIGMFSGLLMIMPVMQMIGFAKNNGFLPLFFKLEKDEKYVHFPDSFGRLKTIIMKEKHPGVLYKKGFGYVDDKGSEYSWGLNKCCFCLPKTGMTLDWKLSQYTYFLKEDNKINDFDEATQEFLGTEKFKFFKKKYRDNVKPDIDNINDELRFLIDEKYPKNELKKNILGESIGFKDFCSFLLYAYNPTSMENAIDTEKIWTKREQMGYKDVDKRMSTAKAIVYILFGVMIFLVVLSAAGGMDKLGSIFG